MILLWYIHLLALSNSNGAIISPPKSGDRQLKILINKWSEIFNSNLGLKAQRNWRQVLSEIFKARLNHNNVNIEQGQLIFDWFTHHCILTKQFGWLKEETHILSLIRVRGLLMNIHEFLNTLICFSYANLNSAHAHLIGNAHETRVSTTNTRAAVYM